MFQHLLNRVAKPDLIVDSHLIELDIPLMIHPVRDSGKIIIIYPGYNSHIDGYNNKYVKIAHLLTEQKIGTVIRSTNSEHPGFDYKISVKEDLKTIIHFACSGTGICGKSNPEIYLMGTSAGASACAAVAYQFPSISKVLLIGTSMDAGSKDVEEGLSQFTGEIYMTGGDNDQIFDINSREHLFHCTKNSKVRKLVEVPNCDHNFTGERNGRILSKAPLWAFANNITYPSPDGGIVLY